MRQPLRHESASILRSPIVLGGLAAIAMTLVVGIGMVLLNGGDKNGKRTGIAPVAITAIATEAQTDHLDGITGKAASTLNVRSGPGNGYSALGVLRRGAEVRIVGQNDDGDWLQIEYPVRSNLHGWVLLSSLEVQGDLASVAIATPDVMPLPEVPTYEVIETPLATPAETTTPTVTPTSSGLPDLVVGGTLVSQGMLVITVTNQGAGNLAATTIDVGVFDSEGTHVLSSATLAVQDLEAGASIDIKTTYIPFAGPEEILAIVDPSGEIDEADDTNNRLALNFAEDPTPEATKTPRP